MVIIGVTPAEMENIRFASTIMMVLVSLHTGVAEIVTRPTDTEVVVGGSTFLNCSTNSKQEIHWFHTPFGSNQERNLVYGYDQFYLQYIGRFEMENSEANGAYNLVIPVVKIEDAGVYECQDETGRGKKESAQLIVLDANPVCEPHLATHELIGPNKCGIEPNQVIISCAVDYNGNESPKLEWRRTSDNISVVEGVTHIIVGNKQVVYNLTIKGNSTVKDGDSFFCSTTRAATSNDGCTSGKIKVKGTGQESSHGDNNCKSCETAVYCICFLLLLPLSISVIALCLKSRNTSRRKQPGKEALEQSPSAAEKRENDQESTSAAVVKKPLLSDLSATEDVVRLIWQEEKAKAQEEQIQQDELMKAKINELAKSNGEYKKKIVKLENKTSHLEEEMRRLEERLYSSAITSYSDKPKLVSTIDINSLEADSKREKRPIFGMTILRNKLFVVTEKSSEIEVYDSVTFQSEPRLQIDEMSNPLDIASCRKKNCLYVFNGEPNNEILRVDLGKSELKKWPIEEDLGRLSVTREGNVIVSLFNGNKIIEYSPDGQLIKEVRLSPADDIKHPWHAIKTTSMHFLFSHGIGNDPLQRVCVVSADEKIVKSFGRKKGKEAQQMNRPVHLLEDGSRNVLVADMKNQRVLLLSQTLEYKGILVWADSSKLRFPMRLCLDEDRGILFVADNNYTEKVCTFDSGRILIFNCKR